MNIITRQLYQHKNGKIFFVNCIGKGLAGQLFVIMTLLEDGEVYVRPVEQFEGEGKQYELVTPSVKK